MAKSRERILKKFKERIASSGPEYEAGVASPRRSWSQAYKEASDRMKAELIAALDRGDHIKGVEATGDAGWAQAAKQVGAPHFTGAAARAADNYGKVVDSVISAGEAASAAAQAMPQTTQEQRIQRSNAAMRAVSTFWKGKR